LRSLLEALWPLGRPRRVPLFPFFSSRLVHCHCSSSPYRRNMFGSIYCSP
jgi:hypothetical protein